MSFYFQALCCWAAFGLTVAIYNPAVHQSPFETAQDFIQFKKDRTLMWCRMEPQLTDDDEWIRDVPTCDFGGYYPNGPATEL